MSTFVQLFIKFCVFLFITGCQFSEDEVVYSCSSAEIKPEIPIKVLEECRHLRNFDGKKNNQIDNGCVWQERHGTAKRTCV